METLVIKNCSILKKKQQSAWGKFESKDVINVSFPWF